MAVEIHGECDPRFRRVKDVFAESFAAGKEVGASVAIFLDGAPVVDLWAGMAVPKEGRAWERDTLVTVWSTTKGITSICAHRLADQGLLDFDAPIADVWPEFAAAGKEKITLRDVLSHRGGLPAFREQLPPEALFDWDVMSAAVAAEAPWWEPGSQHGYHPITFGWLVGEVIRRVTNKTVAAYFRDEIAGPLGLDAQIGLPESEYARCVKLLGPRPAPDEETFVKRLMQDPTSMAARAFSNPLSLVMPGTSSSHEWKRAELPSINGHATARALAKLYGVLAAGGTADGVRVLSKEAIARCAEEQCVGPDAILGVNTRFGLGFWLPQPTDPFGGEGSFGHPGMGGSIGFANPSAGLGFGYVMNQMSSHVIADPRPLALAEAMYASVAS